jgi:hypothetical protein
MPANIRCRKQAHAAPAGTVVAHVRVSTADQAESGAGLDAQRTTITAEAERRGWTMVEWFVEEGTSGGKTPDSAMTMTLCTGSDSAGTEQEPTSRRGTNKT